MVAFDRVRKKHPSSASNLGHRTLILISTVEIGNGIENQCDGLWRVSNSYEYCCVSVLSLYR